MDCPLLALLGWVLRPGGATRRAWRGSIGRSYRVLSCLVAARINARTVARHGPMLDFRSRHLHGAPLTTAARSARPVEGVRSRWINTIPPPVRHLRTALRLKVLYRTVRESTQAIHALAGTESYQPQVPCRLPGAASARLFLCPSMLLGLSPVCVSTVHDLGPTYQFEAGSADQIKGTIPNGLSILPWGTHLRRAQICVHSARRQRPASDAAGSPSSCMDGRAIDRSPRGLAPRSAHDLGRKLTRPGCARLRPSHPTRRLRRLRYPLYRLSTRDAEWRSARRVFLICRRYSYD